MTVKDRDVMTEHRAAIQAYRLVRDRGAVTVAEFAEYAGLRRDVAGRKLRDMRNAKILGVKGLRKEGSAWSQEFGFGDDAYPAVSRHAPGARMIAFVSLLRAISIEGASVTDIVEETGISRGTVQRFLRSARAWRISYISAWTPPVGPGPWVPRWKLGLNADAKKPAPKPRTVINAQHWAKRAERLHAQRIHQALTLPLAA